MLKLSGVSKSLLVGIAVFGLAFLAGNSAFAQATTGTISGVVTDPTGATVPGAIATVRSLATNATRSATTEEDGRFSFSGL